MDQLHSAPQKKLDGVKLKRKIRDNPEILNTKCARPLGGLYRHAIVSLAKYAESQVSTPETRVDMEQTTIFDFLPGIQTTLLDFIKEGDNRKC